MLAEEGLSLLICQLAAKQYALLSGGQQAILLVCGHVP
jgi:hypothetical protein